ncbi:receptor-like protein 56 [Quercus suber]|uniref:Receptor-like protein 56 n=1 Tax=Quercus suber TaxID=58331 RepID=A0AAW0KK74_QUESU
MTNIPFLVDFNVSYNNLSGEILHTGQFSTFPDSSYIGNHQICGPPLSKICIEEGDEEKQGIQKEEQYGFEITSFYLSMGLGFIAGYCAGTEPGFEPRGGESMNQKNFK